MSLASLRAITLVIYLYLYLCLVISLYVFLSLCLTVLNSICLYVSLSLFSVCGCLSLSVSIYRTGGWGYRMYITAKPRQVTCCQRLCWCLSCCQRTPGVKDKGADGPGSQQELPKTEEPKPSVQSSEEEE